MIVRAVRVRVLCPTALLDPEAQGFPLETTAAGERVSGVPNLAHITFARDRTDEIRRLQEVAPSTCTPPRSRDQPASESSWGYALTVNVEPT